MLFWKRVISGGNVIYAADPAAVCYGTDDTVEDAYGSLYLTLAQWQENTQQDKGHRSYSGLSGTVPVLAGRRDRTVVLPTEGNTLCLSTGRGFSEKIILLKEYYMNMENPIQFSKRQLNDRTHSSLY